MTHNFQIQLAESLDASVTLLPFTNKMPKSVLDTTKWIWPVWFLLSIWPTQKCLACKANGAMSISRHAGGVREIGERCEMHWSWWLGLLDLFRAVGRGMTPGLMNFFCDKNSVLMCFFWGEKEIEPRGWHEFYDFKQKLWTDWTLCMCNSKSQRSLWDSHLRNTNQGNSHLPDSLIFFPLNNSQFQLNKACICL